MNTWCFPMIKMFHFLKMLNVKFWEIVRAAFLFLEMDNEN